MEAPSKQDIYGLSLDGDAESAAVVVDEEVNASASDLRERANVLAQANLGSLAAEYRRRANEGTIRHHYHLLNEEEYELWNAYLHGTPTGGEFASEIPDGALARLKKAVERDCFDSFIVWQRRKTGEVMVIGFLRGLQDDLFATVAFWAPADVEPVTIGALRDNLQVKRDREVRAEADEKARELKREAEYKAKQRKVTRLTRLTWSAAGVFLTGVNLAFLGLLGWSFWCLAPLLVSLVVAWGIWADQWKPRNLYDLRRFTAMPLAILCLLMTIGLGLTYAQFGSAIRAVTLCGHSSVSTSQTRVYLTAEGGEYEFTQEAVQQLAAEAGNAAGYGRARVKIVRHALYGDPVVTSVDLVPTDDYTSVNKVCDELWLA